MAKNGGLGLTQGKTIKTITGVRRSAPIKNVRKDVTGEPLPLGALPYFRKCASRVHGAKRHRFCVYAIFVESGAGPGYIKIGITENLLKRLDSLQVGCPFPIGLVGVLDAGHYPQTAQDLEERFHERFASRRTSGEWFQFDFSSELDKADFNHGSREILRRYFGPNHPWWVKKTWNQLRREISKIKAETDKRRMPSAGIIRAVGDPGF